MSVQVLVADRASRELEAFAIWWSEHHSTAQAERWYTGFYEAIASLKNSPERCAYARENGLASVELRQLHYGVGARPTHRAIFTIRKDAVVVLAVRHLAQQDLRKTELP